MTLLLLAMTTACGLRTILPGHPVVGDAELAAFNNPMPSGVAYESEPLVPFPVLALQPFGVQYAVDIVMVSDSPHWSMHEYARLDTPHGNFWIAKDSDPTGRQTIVADIPDLNTWLPEIPAPRYERALRVADNSDGKAIDVCVSYTNPRDEAVEACASGSMPEKPPKKRNGNTMGHSRDVVAAVLDIDRFLLFNTSGHIQIGDDATRVEKVLGLVPFRSILRQTQAGLAIANYRLSESDGAFTLQRPSPADPQWPTQGTEQWRLHDGRAHHDNGVVAFAHEFSNHELHRITVDQHGAEHRTFELTVQPALPDLRRRFQGTARSEFVMNVNGQPGHGRGTLAARWVDAATVLVSMDPTEPRWLTDRPMETTVTYNPDGTVDVAIRRTQSR